MIGWCESCGKGPVPCAHIQSSMGDSVRCYMCTDGEFDPYGEMDDGETGLRVAAPLGVINIGLR